MKKFSVEKNFGVKIFFGEKKNFTLKKILVKKKLVKKKFWSKKIWSKKFSVKKILLKKVFCQEKKWVGLTLGRGFWPPPPENIRVKIVLHCC